MGRETKTSHNTNTWNNQQRKKFSVMISCECVRAGLLEEATYLWFPVPLKSRSKSLSLQLVCTYSFQTLGKGAATMSQRPGRQILAFCFRSNQFTTLINHLLIAVGDRNAKSARDFNPLKPFYLRASRPWFASCVCSLLASSVLITARKLSNDRQGRGKVQKKRAVSYYQQAINSKLPWSSFDNDRK